MMNDRLQQIKTDWEEEKETYQFRQLALEEQDIEWLIEKAPKELKHKKDIPTVIEYQGRRYVLDAGNRK